METEITQLDIKNYKNKITELEKEIFKYKIDATVLNQKLMQLEDMAKETLVVSIQIVESFDKNKQ